MAQICSADRFGIGYSEFSLALAKNPARSCVGRYPGVSRCGCVGRLRAASLVSRLLQIFRPGRLVAEPDSLPDSSGFNLFPDCDSSGPAAASIRQGLTAAKTTPGRRDLLV